MNFGTNPQHDFPKMRGGDQRPFGTFPKIHPFWSGEASLIYYISSPCNELMSGFAHDVPLTEHMFLLLGLHYVLLSKIIMTMKIIIMKIIMTMKIVFMTLAMMVMKI